MTGHEANFVCLCLDHAINEAGLFCHLGCVCELPGGETLLLLLASALLALAAARVFLLYVGVGAAGT